MSADALSASGWPHGTACKDGFAGRKVALSGAHAERAVPMAIPAIRSMAHTDRMAGSGTGAVTPMPAGAATVDNVRFLFRFSLDPDKQRTIRHL